MSGYIKQTDTSDDLASLRHIHTLNRSQQECDTNFLGTAGRRKAQLAHKQETAGVSTQWDFLLSPSPARNAAPLPYARSLLIPANPFALIPLPPLTSTLHLLSTSLLTLSLDLSQELRSKQEVINQQSVPL